MADVTWFLWLEKVWFVRSLIKLIVKDTGEI